MSGSGSTPTTGSIFGGGGAGKGFGSGTGTGPGFGSGTGTGTGFGSGTGTGTGFGSGTGTGTGFGFGTGTGTGTGFGSGAGTGTGFGSGAGTGTGFGSGAGTGTGFGSGTGTGTGFPAPATGTPSTNPTTAAPPTNPTTAAPPTNQTNQTTAAPPANQTATAPPATTKASSFRMKKYCALVESKKLRKKEGGTSGGTAAAPAAGPGKGLTLGGSNTLTGFGTSQQKTSLSGAASSLVYTDIPQQVSELVHPVSYDNRTAALFFTPREWRNPSPDDDPFFEWTRNDALRQRKQKLKPDYASLFEAKSQTIRGENVSERMDPASHDKPIIRMNEHLLNLLKIENRQRIRIDNDKDIVFLGSCDDRPMPFSYFARPGYGSVLFDRLNHAKYLSRMLFDVEAKIFVPEDGKATFAKLVTEREDKEVTRDEFIRMLSQEIKGPITKEKAANLFDVIDVSRDGAVQREEFTAFFDRCLEIVREAREETPDERRLEELLFDYLHLFFNACSVKKKGYLTHEEFDNLVEMSEFEISWPSEVGTDSITYDDLTNHIRNCKRAWLQSLCNEKIVIERGYVHVNHDTAGDPFNKEAIVTMYLEGNNRDLTDRVNRFFEKHREAKKIHWGEDSRGRDEGQAERFILVFSVPNFDNGPYGLY